MKPFDKVQTTLLSLVLLLGSLYAISFALPVLTTGDAGNGSGLLWYGETFHELNGWQTCKLLIEVNREAETTSTFLCVLSMIQMGGVAIVANPIFCLGLVLLLRRQWSGARIAGIIATILATIVFLRLSDSLLVGHYLWFSCMILLTVSGFVGAALQRDRSQTQMPPDSLLSTAPQV